MRGPRNPPPKERDEKSAPVTARSLAVGILNGLEKTDDYLAVTALELALTFLRAAEEIQR